MPVIARLRARPGRRGSTLMLVGAGALATGMGGAPAAGEPAAVVSFEATASAEGFRIGVAAPSFVLVDQLIDVGAPVAQSTVDGLGESRAFASNPYPGELVILGPGLFAGFSGLPSPPGSYPLYAESSFPTAPESNVSQPNYELSARSAEFSSEAVASAGGSTTEDSIARVEAVAVSTRDATTGEVTALAESAADGVSLAGGALRIGAVRATAQVVQAPGGEPVRSSSLSVEGASIAGQAVGFDESGFVLAGTATPLPDANPLNAVLEQAQISVRYLEPTSTPDGVVSAGILVSQQLDVPEGPNVVVSYVFGRAVAHATAVGEAAGSTDGALYDEGSALGSAPSPPFENAAVVPPSPAATPGGGGATSPASGGGTTNPRVVRTDTSVGDASMGDIYLFLVVGAVVALGGNQLVRMRAVRMA